MKALIIVYMIVINLVSIIVTAYDKYAAIKGFRRIRERTLLLLSFFFGSFSMYITMLIIRHKTRKPKFMISIPIMMIAQIVALIFIAERFF